MELTENQSSQMTDEQIDDLVDRSEKASNTPVEMEAPTEGAEKVPASEIKQDPVTHEFTHNGKPIKATTDQLIKWAQQGIDYPQKAQKINQMQADMQRKAQEYQQKYGIYQQIDDWAKQNPDKWKILEQGWKSGGQIQAQAAGMPPAPDPYAPKIQALEQKLTQTEKFMQQMMERDTAAQRQKEDTALDAEIQSFRDSHKDLDWSSLDDNGKTLETRILEHAQTNGIPKFTAAARDMLLPDLIARAEAQAKQAVSRGIQNKTKLGILGESPSQKPKGLTSPGDVKKQSYEDLAREAIAEMRGAS